MPDRMVQLAVLHAEFEALHPFLDGNGRLGRMLIPLLLWQWGVIQRPHFYVSGYLESHREEYYEGLLSVSRDRDWTAWVRFFLEALRIQAEESLAKTQGVLALYEDLKGRVPEMTRSGTRSRRWTGSSTGRSLRARSSTARLASRPTRSTPSGRAARRRRAQRPPPVVRQAGRTPHLHRPARHRRGAVRTVMTAGRLGREIVEQIRAHCARLAACYADVRNNAACLSFYPQKCQTNRFVAHSLHTRPDPMPGRPSCSSRQRTTRPVAGCDPGGRRGRESQPEQGVRAAGRPPRLRGGRGSVEVSVLGREGGGAVPG